MPSLADPARRTPSLADPAGARVALTMRWESAAITDRGRLRPQNEDAYIARPDLGLFVVADGMGGHAAGEVASAMAVETVARDLSAPPATAQDAERALVASLGAANRAILERAAREPEKTGMGTTLTALLLLPQTGTSVIAHVGDSRAYRLRDGGLEQLTRDHTWVQEQVDAGLLSPAQAHHHPYSSVLTRVIGVYTDVEVDTRRDRARAGDLLLLCSDGLTGMVDDDELRTLLARDLPLHELAAQLVEAANLRGGLDNITAVLVRSGE